MAAQQAGRPAHGGSGELDAVTLTALIARAARRPFATVDAVFHLGTQVDMNAALDDAMALVARAEDAELESAELREQLHDAVADTLRDAYR